MKLIEAVNIPGGVEKWWLHNGDDNKSKITVETILDVAPLLRQNSEKMNASTRDFRGSEMHPVATFDGATLDSFARAKGLTFAELMLGRSEKAQSALNELLNGREFRAFRIKPGQVDVKRGLR